VVLPILVRRLGSRRPLRDEARRCPVHLRFHLFCGGFEETHRTGRCGGKCPEPPSFVTGYAADVWWETAPDLFRLGLLSVLDQMPLAAFCMAAERWREAELALARIAAKDSLMKGSSSGAPGHAEGESASQGGRRRRKRHGAVRGGVWNDRRRPKPHCGGNQPALRARKV
jgi:hypothetical protein